MVSLERCRGDLASLGQRSALDSYTGGLWSAQSECMSTFGDAALIGPSPVQSQPRATIAPFPDGLPSLSRSAKLTDDNFCATLLEDLRK